MSFSIELYSPTMSIQGLNQWLSDIVSQDAAQFPHQMLITADDYGHDVSEFRCTRTFENTFFPNKELVRERIRKAKAAGSCLGMFLCGLPGCGKTSMAQALLNELGPEYHGILVSAHEATVIRKYIFASDMDFSYNSYSYCVDPSHRVLIFDEMDRLPFCQTRKTLGGDGGNSGKPPLKKQKIDKNAPSDVKPDRIAYSSNSRNNSPGRPLLDVGQFLELLSGVQPRSCWIIGMTNFPERIDEALLRRGRFGDIVVNFTDGLPLNCKLDIFKHVAGRIPNKEETNQLDKVIKTGSEAEGFADSKSH